VALPEVSESPELTGPDAGVTYPLGKSDPGSSTDSSCVPVSCPAAAGSGVMDAAGSELADDETDAEADDEADAEADGEAGAEGDDEAAEDEELLLDDEQPATVTSTPTAAAMTAAAGRTRRMTEDTVLSTSDLALITRQRIAVVAARQMLRTLRPE
jgi:hypothetical protein